MAQGDVAAVIGGGPAGLIAAEELARSGISVTVYDHKPSVGRKFLLAGRSGMNITNSEPMSSFVTNYGPAAHRLRAALDGFGPDDLRAWCAGLGESTYVGSSGRVFPASFRATPLLRAWLQRLGELGVRFVNRTRWLGWDSAGSHRFAGADGHEFTVASDVTVFALGGASWPRVGSDGGWVSEFERAGIAVNPLRPANVGVSVAWTNDFVDRYEGQPLKNVSVSTRSADVELTVRGDPVVTRSGLEGGPIYALSVPIREAIDLHGMCELAFDLHPDQSVERVIERLAKRRPKDSTSTWLRRSIGLHPVMIGLLREATGNELPADTGQVAALVKHATIRVIATMPIERAISTAGGVMFSELDGSLMLLRRPGTFVAGEMLDWEAPTGGYLLQASFSTGVAAARGALAFLGR
jgi:uncharacterized flavoprotein (TIGR03862 family)